MSSYYLLFVFIALCALSNGVLGDVYMANPRGNNDRCREEGDRQNAQRLFDSENNARGGYCWGPELSYFEGSILSVEWTAQHSCGSDNTKCNIVLQYMCSHDYDGADQSLVIRDGTVTTTIPTSSNPADGDQYYNYKAAASDGVYQYGMNEPLSEYTSCRARSRNQGLFAGVENINNNNGAMATRQNAGATRHGFECSEERDYYPYWHPSVWKDIAVLVDNDDECTFYERNSQNVKAKSYCSGTTDAQKAANNNIDCLKAEGQWLEVKPWGNGKPDCKQAAWSRDNHLGNGAEGHTNSYNWTIPRTSDEDCIKAGGCACVLRIRYNITVGEVMKTDDSTKNGKSVSPVQDDPTVAVEGQNFTLALDTAQTGRGFQDRSFMFRIQEREKGVPKEAKIYNLNVRGKRGNIVQTYPATEYDFVPTFLEVDQNDYIHFQWTGCDTNPQGNQGEGKVRTDRSNIVQIADMSKNYPLKDSELKKTNLLFKDDKVRARMAMIGQVNCKSYDDLKTEAGGGDISQNSQNCMVLNAAPDPRFTGGLVKMTDVGKFFYMSTRNNNFSNRSQKASIKVKETWKAWKTALIVIGGVAGVGVGAAAGAVFYAKRHPLSKVSEFVHKVPGLNKI